MYDWFTGWITLLLLVILLLLRCIRSAGIKTPIYVERTLFFRSRSRRRSRRLSFFCRFSLSLSLSLVLVIPQFLAYSLLFRLCATIRLHKCFWVFCKNGTFVVFLFVLPFFFLLLIFQGEGERGGSRWAGALFLT